MKKIVSALISLFFIGSAYGQDQIGDLIKGNLKDAEKIFDGYVEPVMNSFSTGLNQGWYNTAKPHKLGGFDLTISINAMLIPASESFYEPDALTGANSSIRLNQNSPDFPKAPTFFGPTENRPVYDVYEGNTQVDQFEGAPGVLDLKKEIGSNLLPVPVAQLGIGLPKGTDLKVRFFPQRNFGDAKAGLFGVGIMHDVKQWIPGMKKLPFDLSGFVGFTKMTASVKIDNPDYDNQKGEFSATGVTVQGIISKKISVLTLYGSAGYNLAKSNMAMKGTYVIDDANNVVVNDPFEVSNSASGPRIGAGFRLKLAVITLHVDYTLQRYSCLGFGFGINVR